MWTGQKKEGRRKSYSREIRKEGGPGQSENFNSRPRGWDGTKNGWKGGGEQRWRGKSREQAGESKSDPGGRGTTPSPAVMYFFFYPQIY